MKFDAIYFRIISILGIIGLLILMFGTTEKYQTSIDAKEWMYFLIFITIIFQCASSILRAIIKVYDAIPNKKE